jgi:hypothetical protein
MNKIKTNTERAIIGFLVSLALKGGLDMAYGEQLKDAKTDSWLNMWNVVCSAPTLQVAVLLLTLIRFVFGANRILEATEDDPAASAKMEGWVNLWNMAGGLIVFVLFYMTALSVKRPDTFYSTLIAVHFWDGIWFAIVAMFSDWPNPDLKRAMRVFIVVDGLTVFTLVLVLWLAPSHHAVWGALVMVGMAALDVKFNFRFLFPKPTEQPHGR